MTQPRSLLINLLLKNKHNNKDAIYYRAMINYEKGNKTQAKADFQKLLSSPKYNKFAKGYIKSIDSE